MNSENTGNYLVIDALVLPRITHLSKPAISQQQLNSLKFIHGLPLADPRLYELRCIDILLGVTAYVQILRSGFRKHPNSMLAATETALGWILFGSLAPEPPEIQVNTVLVSEVTERCNSLQCQCDPPLLSMIRNFWEIEEYASDQTQPVSDTICEELYKASTQRNQKGQCIVTMPRREPFELGESRVRALRCLLSSERRRSGNTELNEAYVKFMQEYEALGHMIQVLASQSESKQRYFIPHHAVCRNKKIRIVFNASSPTSNGKSLNDLLYPGPALQRNIVDVLVKWRVHRVMMTADIVKMYRGFLIHPDHQALQTILWRESPNQSIQEYELLTVTYGTAPAPFLALRSMIQLAEDEESRYPEAAKIIRYNAYVDDLLFGDDDIEGLRKKHRQLKLCLESAQFKLSKKRSNVYQLLNSDENRQSVINFDLDRSPVLGIQWNASTDAFTFSVNIDPISEYTKRKVLSVVSKIFDPIGLLQPIIIVGKILIQQLWKVKQDWDDPLPQSVVNKWSHFFNELQSVQEISVTRWVNITASSKWEIHGFADASEKAHGAAIYIRAVTE